MDEAWWRMRATHEPNAVIFVDDGYPEAEEHTNNYIAYDAMDPEDYRRAVALARCRLCELRGRCTAEPGACAGPPPRPTSSR